MFSGTLVSVGTSATLLLQADCDLDVQVTANAGVNIAIGGDSSVTVNNGFRLVYGSNPSPGKYPNVMRFRLKEGDSLYGIASSADQEVFVLATSAVGGA